MSPVAAQVEMTSFKVDNLSVATMRHSIESGMRTVRGGYDPTSHPSGPKPVSVDLTKILLIWVDIH